MEEHELTEEKVSRLCDLFGDVYFYYGIDITAKLFAQHSKSTVHYAMLEVEAQESVANVRSDLTLKRPTFKALRGVPFAAPPTRFTAPKSAQHWDHVLDANRDPEPCMQATFEDNKAEGKEDCLYLNVFTKGIEGKRPVIVYIHGGAFIIGAANVYQPDYILEEDVVLVVIQYRLSMFGFLTTGDSEAPGNIGMLDQVEALRWIRKNIDAFGGDSQSITLMGQSAGAASVNLHLISPMSKGLFDRAVSLSGSALNHWSNIPKQELKAAKLAEHFDCPDSTTSRGILDCLRTVPADSLAEAAKIFEEFRMSGNAKEPMSAFSPQSSPDCPFMHEEPIQRMQTGRINHVPHLVVVTEKEGAWVASKFLPDLPGSKVWKAYWSNFDRLGLLTCGLTDQSPDPKAALNKIKDYFHLENMNVENLTEEKVSRLSDMFGDAVINFGLDVSTKLLAQHSESSVHFALVELEASNSVVNVRSDMSLRRPQYQALRQATHATDVIHLFPFLAFRDLPPEDVEFSRKFVRLLVDFARTGRLEWPSLQEKQCHAVLDRHEELEIRPGLPFQERMKFWRTLPIYWNATTLVSARRSEL